jgi:hypothetical protein
MVQSQTYGMQKVAQEMGGGISSVECRLRLQEITRDVRKSGTWSAEEDEQLRAAVHTHGKVWWKVCCPEPYNA